MTEHFPRPLIPIIPPALPDVLHVAALEHPLDDEARLGIIVQLLKDHIPEAAGEDGAGLVGHAVKGVPAVPRDFHGHPALQVRFLLPIFAAATLQDSRAIAE